MKKEVRWEADERWGRRERKEACIGGRERKREGGRESRIHR